MASQGDSKTEPGGVKRLEKRHSSEPVSLQENSNASPSHGELHNSDMSTLSGKPYQALPLLPAPSDLDSFADQCPTLSSTTLWSESTTQDDDHRVITRQGHTSALPEPSTTGTIEGRTIKSPDPSNSTKGRWQHPSAVHQPQTSHVGTSLIENAPTLYGRAEYGAVPQTGFRKTSFGQDCNSEKLRRESDLYVEGDDRRNEYFTLKRYIFMTLGMPNTPLVTETLQKISTGLAIPFYILLFIWGIAIFIIAIQSDGWLWSRRCPEIIPAKVMTMLAGTFFVLLGLFWLYVLWWRRDSPRSLPLSQRGFTTVALFWWTLCMYFFGICAVLAAEVYEHDHLIVTVGNAKNRFYPSLTVTCEDGDSLEVPNNMVPLWALGSMVALWVIYLVIFVIATISIYSV